jgi:dTMP kinase
MSERGLFVVLDGIDGCGKSTQAARLAETLRRDAPGATPGGTPRETLHLREPGSTKLGEMLRGLLLERGGDLTSAVEALLFAAARRQMLDEVVAPALARGAHVVVERFHASTFAYQGVAGELGEETVLELLERFAGSPRPDLMIVLDLAPELAAERLARRRDRSSDRIEDKGLDFQRRVSEGFRRYAKRVGNRTAVALIDASGSQDEVEKRVLAEVRRALR